MTRAGNPETDASDTDAGSRVQKRRRVRLSSSCDSCPRQRTSRTADPRDYQLMHACRAWSADMLVCCFARRWVEAFSDSPVFDPLLVFVWARSRVSEDLVERDMD